MTRKLNATDERDIYHRFNSGNPNTQAAIASDYGVSVSTVRRAIRRYQAESAKRTRQLWRQVRERALEPDA